LNADPRKLQYKKLFELRSTKLQFERGPALKFGVTQFKKFLVLQLARIRIQTALLLWCTEAFLHDFPLLNSV
jgi:hypothetical protein